MDSLNYYFTYYEYPQPSTSMQPQPYYGFQLQPPPPQFNYQPPAALSIYSEPPQHGHFQHLEQPKPRHNRHQRRRGKRFHESAPYPISQPTPSTSNFQSQQAVELIDLTLPSEFENTHESAKTSNESADDDASQSAPEVSYFIEKDEFCKIFKKNGNIIYLRNPEALKRHLKMYDALVAIKRGEETKVEFKKEIPEIINETEENK